MSPSFFQATTYVCALGKKCRAFLVRKVCGARPENRHSFSRFRCLTGTASRAAIEGVKVCRSGERNRRCLTVAHPPIDCLSRIWWPADRSCFRRANRELRCDSGTAPPLYPGAEAGCFQAIAMVRRKPRRSREGMQPAEPGSQKTYQRSRACQPARAGRQARPRPVDRSSSNAPASNRVAEGVNSPGLGLRTRFGGCGALACVHFVWTRNTPRRRQHVPAPA